MTIYKRYFLFIVSCFLSFAVNAADHIICSLTDQGITAQMQNNVSKTNVYTCINTYNTSFPAIQLKGNLIGVSTGNSTITGTCTTQPLAPNGSCEFMLNALFTKPGAVTFNLRVSVGELYYIDLPTISTTIESVNGLTWPGFNSGFAQAGSTGSGFGSYLPNAVDVSGHPVTYTFAIIAGPGEITGTQVGNFSLVGVDATTVIQITANVDDAEPVVGTPFAVQISTMPTKVLAFYNNSPETIYPIIESPILNMDNWLKAQFQTLNPTIEFQQTQIHRVYVNGTNGILPGQTAFVAVPFYSTLVANPGDGSVADQYVDWWNAMRVYLYDVQSSFLQQYNVDAANTVTLYSPGPSCISGCSQVSIFSSPGIGVPTNAPQQLLEYTFADVVTSTLPYDIDLTHVDYDYSGVDQIYLPVAMGAYGSSLVGYTGTTVDLPTFRTNMNTFVQQTGWPTYAGLPYPRIPGTYNVVLNYPNPNPELTDRSATVNQLTNFWNTCIGASNLDCFKIRDLFYNNYLDCNILPPIPNPNDFTPANVPSLLEHIYGWVPFCSTPLTPPPPAPPSPTYVLAVNAYHDLQYTFNSNYANEFNPYVQLVHQTLQMNVYAYSIDDAVGNINTLGDGIVITVGGATGLSNPLQYQNINITRVIPGTLPGPTPNPVFERYGVCSSTALSALNVGTSFAFQLPASSYPCMITLADNNNKLYQFVLLQPAPFLNPPTLNYVSCAGVIDPAWCASVNVDFNQTGTIITTVPTL